METPIKRESHWLRNTFVVIVVGLLIWEFGVPYIDDSIKTPSDYILEYFPGINLSIFETDFSDATWTPVVINQTTGLKTTFTNYMGYDYDMAQYNTYSLGIETTNLPTNFLETMTWQVQVLFWNVTISDWSLGAVFAYKISGYQTWLQDSWFIPEDDVFINYEITYSFSMSLLDFDGNPLPVNPSSSWTTQIIRMNDYTGSVP